MENNENQGRPDNWVDAHPELYPDAVTSVILAGVKKAFGPKKLEVKHEGWTEDGQSLGEAIDSDPDYQGKVDEARNK